MGCFMSKKERAEGETVGHELVHITHRTAGRVQADGTLAPRAISLPIVEGHPPMYHHTGTGLPRPITSAGVPATATTPEMPVIPRIGITQHFDVAQQDADLAHVGGAFERPASAGPAVGKAMSITNVESGGQAGVTPIPLRKRGTI